MINAKFGMVNISGSTPMVLADLTCIVSAIAEHGLKDIDTKEELKAEVLKAVEDGFEDAEAESQDEDGMGSDLEDALASLFRSMAESLEKGKGEK